jgi:hypothetical protein
VSYVARLDYYSRECVFDSKNARAIDAYSSDAGAVLASVSF